MPSPSSHARRNAWLLRAAFLALLCVAAAQACRARTPVGAERAWSVQLHLHGSFSEGAGSMDSHAYEAGDVGCDVLWWSDHDFRVTGHELVSRFGFEGWEEPLDRNEPWRVRLRKYADDKKRVQFLARPPGARARFVGEPVREGEHSLRLSARSEGAAFEPLTLVFGAERSLQRHPLATGLRLGLALYPEVLSRDAHVVLELLLSEHAPREGLGLESRVLRYEIGPGAAGAAERRGATYVVPVACELGRWNELELSVSADATRGFPGSPGEDNSLHRIAFGLETRNGAAGEACFDDLRIEARLAGSKAYAREGELMGEVGALYPQLTQLLGLEVSYDSRHLNLFCEETPLPDYEALAELTPRDPENPELLDQRAFRDAICDWAVRATHARGGLVSYNHPFGATFEENEKPRTNEEQLAILLRNRAEGADLLEVGYRDRGGASLEDHLWLWDQAALAGLALVGTGVSDSHGGPENRWRGSPNNFVSWIYAPSPSKHDLIEGLRAGRVFFGDIERFGGTLELVLDSGERMGACLVSGRKTLELTLIATRTHAGQRVVLVESGVRTRTFPVEGEEFRQALSIVLPAQGVGFVRFELHDETGAIALSNPIRFAGSTESGQFLNDSTERKATPGAPANR